jgi:hypothetical protein
MSVNTMSTASRLMQAGWVTGFVVSILVYVARPNEELRSAVVFGAITAAMAVWVSLRASRASAVTSLVLGVLWTVMFSAYVVAAFTAQVPHATLIVVTDGIAVGGGGLILWGAASALRQRRDHAPHVPVGTP